MRGGNAANNKASSGGGGGEASSSTSIPTASRKIVQNLREIVNSPEQEIYAMLKECNMDPNEAINRLLSQDPFHEVKSKREKKKESRDSTESRSRVIGGNSGHGRRGSSDRSVARNGSTYMSSADNSMYSKASYRKDDEYDAYSSFASAVPTTTGNTGNPRTLSSNDYVIPTGTAGDHPGLQPSWTAAPPGQISMADIVKSGRPQPPHGRTSGISNATQQNVNNYHPLPLPSMPSHTDVLPVPYMTPNESELSDWPSEDPPVLSSFYLNDEGKVSLHFKSQPDEIPVAKDELEQNHLNYDKSVSSAIQMKEDNSLRPDPCDDNLYDRMSSGQFVQEDGPVSVTSVAENLHRLSLPEDQRAESDDESCSVKIPDHLRVQSQHFSHLSFGSFRKPQPLKRSEEALSTDDTPPTAQVDARCSDYHKDEHRVSSANQDVGGRPAVGYDPASASQSETLKGRVDSGQGTIHFPFPSAAPAYTFEAAQPQSAFSHTPTSSEILNHAPFSTAIPYTNSLPSTLLPSSVTQMRESDLAYSPFPAAQPISAKYGDTFSSSAGPAISLPEALKGVNLGSTLPQQLSLPPYPQPTLPLGHFTNMIGYPLLPQSYTYLPSPFQQAFGGSSSYHQSLSAVLPQYKNSISASNLTPSAAIASGYGGFGNSAVHGSFPLNAPAVPSASSTIGYEELLRSQYKDANPLMSLQQNENPAMWVHGHGTKTMSAVPSSTYYGFQGQGQQAPQEQHFGAPGYPNFYQPHSAVSMDFQQQNVRDMPLGGGSQGQPQPKQTQQIWQNGY